jgi:hypothetical protein
MSDLVEHGVSKMSTPRQRPILVTGAHRSGTTWVGKMLAASAQVAYISEPLNVLHRPGVLRVPVKYWYTYICPDNEAVFLPALGETLEFHYHTWSEIKSLRSRKDFLRMGRDLSIFFKGKTLKLRPLLKDTFAVFSAPWFASRLNCQVVITIRHPAAFASSLKRLDWPFELEHLLEQPLLMRDWLEPFRAEIEGLQPDDLIGASALLWRMVYHTVDRYRKVHPEFQVVRHEDLSLDPIQGFRSLYKALDLEYTSKVQQTIQNSSSSQNPGEVSKSRVHAVKLDSRSNLQNWKRRLTPEEISRIREMTEEVACLYYPDISWE